MQKVLDRFGTDIILVCDNGSENFGETFELLDEANKWLNDWHFYRPHTKL